MRSEVEQAVALLQDGDKAAIERAVELLQRSVFSFSMRVCGQRQDAEDTMQEVLFKSLPHLPKFDSPRALTVWLYKVAKNQCLMSRRKSKFAPKSELSLEELMPHRDDLQRLDGRRTITPELAAIRGEEGRRLREVVRTLPPQYRIVLVLRDMEGLTDDEVAEITGLRPATVRVRLHRARLFVRKELHQRIAPRLQPKQRKSESPARSGQCKKMFAELSDYLDGQLDDFSCEELESHLDACEPCKKFLRDLESAIKRCQASPAACPDPKKAAVLRRQLLTAYGKALAGAKN